MTSLSSLKLVIFCGGLGTRIRDVAIEVPKPLVPIGEKPIVYHVMRYYSLFGVNEFILCLGYKSRQIKDYFFNLQRYHQDYTMVLGDPSKIEFHGEPVESDWRITMAETGVMSLTSTRLSRIRKYLGDDEHFLMTYADGLADVDLEKLLEFHLAEEKTMTVTGVVAPGRFGEMIFDHDTGVVSDFTEKAPRTAGRISGGFFVCRRGIFDYLPQEDVMLERGPMQQIAANGQMRTFQHDGFWHPMDTPRDYEMLNELYISGKAPWTRRPGGEGDD